MVFTGQCTWRHTLVKWSCRCSKTPSGFHPMRPRAHHLRASKEMPRSRPLSNPWTSQGAEAVYFFECASGESIVSVKFFSCHCRIAFTFFWPLHFFSRKLFLGGFFFVNHRNRPQAAEVVGSKTFFFGSCDSFTSVTTCFKNES